MPASDDALMLDALAASFARACREAGVSYVFVGGFAVVVWGQPRTTSDIDVLLDYEEPDVPGLVESLEDEDLEVERHDLMASLKDGSHVTVFTPDPVLSIDVKPAREPHEKREIEDGVEIDLDTGPVRVASPEDTVVFKILFGTEQDLQDARSILARQSGRLDHDRLWTAARRQGNLEEVRAIVNEVDDALSDDRQAS